jgi:hypothetical protein
MSRSQKVALAAAVGAALLLLRHQVGGAAEVGVGFDPRRGECYVYEDGQQVRFSCTSREDGEAFARANGYL